MDDRESKIADVEQYTYWSSDEPWDLMVDAIRAGRPRDEEEIVRMIRETQRKIQGALKDIDRGAALAALEQMEAFMAARRD